MHNLKFLSNLLNIIGRYYFWMYFDVICLSALDSPLIESIKVTNNRKEKREENLTNLRP